MDTNQETKQEAPRKVKPRIRQPKQEKLALVPTANAQAPAPASAQPSTAPLVDPLLASILARPRKHDSYSEKVFLQWLKDYLETFAKEYKTDVVTHSEGCMSITLKTKDSKASQMLFSCHVDTMDPKDTEQHPHPRKKLVYDSNMEFIALDKSEPLNKGFSLGADDGAGVWLMLKMLKAGVGGTYLFHRGEEVGCIGSRAMASKEYTWLGQHKIAIAFDRPNDYEIITHQSGSRGASDECGTAIMQQLNATGSMKYELSNRGVLTDTKQYFYIIPECFNLGVGYANQHTGNEDLDYGHLCKLLERLLVLDWENLPVKRDPKAYDTSAYRGGYESWNGYTSHRPATQSKPYTPQGFNTKGGTSGKGDSFRYIPGSEVDDALEAVKDATYDEIYALIDDEPSTLVYAVVGLLQELDAEKARNKRLSKLLGC